MKETKQKRPYGFWNWGTGIAIAIIAGALGMLFLVYKSSQVHFDMVEQDYYSQEVKFDQKKAARQNLAALSSDITIRQQDDYLVIQFPQECIAQELEGSLVLYRPSDQARDITLPLMIDQNGILLVEDNKLVSGKYILKGDWTMNDQDFNVEKSFFVQK